MAIALNNTVVVGRAAVCRTQRPRRVAPVAKASGCKGVSSVASLSLPFVAKRRNMKQRNSRQPTSRVEASASSPPIEEKRKKSAVLPIVITLAVAAVAALVGVSTAVPGSREALVEILAKSGFTAAFGLIFVSEIGDKTFFIAALLAMERGRAVVLAGATSALAAMTIISVALGRLFSRLPESLSSTLPLGEYLAVALLLFFGVSTLRTALATPAANDKEGEELEEAEKVVKEADGKKGWLGVFIQTFSLIFVAEWGDRSMLATVALGAAQNPFGVAAGAITGHFLATLIAVIGGAFLSKYISERVVGIIGGTLFLVFAAATFFGIF